MLDLIDLPPTTAFTCGSRQVTALRAGGDSNPR
jgi:hypothetical protein